MASTEEEPNEILAAAVAAAAAAASNELDIGTTSTTDDGITDELAEQPSPLLLQQAGQDNDAEQEAVMTAEQSHQQQQQQQHVQEETINNNNNHGAAAASMLGFDSTSTTTSTAAVAAEYAVVAAASAPAAAAEALLGTNPTPPEPKQEDAAMIEASSVSISDKKKESESTTSTQATAAQEANAIWEPLEHDVLSGRGALVNAHTGNKNFRALCFARKSLFDNANHAAKKRICAETWSECVQKYGSRYLKKKDGNNKGGGPWYEQPASVAELKAAQVMRDYKRPDRLMQREIMAAKGKQRVRSTATPLDDVPVAPVPPQPLVECPEGVTANDCLAGRGAFVNGHPGNQRLRELAAERKEAFDNANYSQKRVLADEIVAIIKSLDPPGRFLSKNNPEGKWMEISQEKCVHKACQVMLDMDRADRKEREERRRLRKERKQVKMAEMMAAATTAVASSPNGAAPVMAAPDYAPTVETQNPEEKAETEEV